MGRPSTSTRISLLRLAVRLGLVDGERTQDVRRRLEAAGVRTSLFVCATPRTGSNLLDGLLASTQLIGEPAEDFGAVFETEVLPFAGRTGLGDHLVRCAQRAGDTGVYSVKLHLHQHGLFLHLLRLLRGAHGLSDVDLIRTVFPQPRFVWLKRDDTVAQAVSWWRASESGSWIDSDVPRREPVFDFARIDAYVTRIRVDDEAWRTWFAANGIEPLVVTYEELVANPDRSVREILSLAAVDVPAGLVVTPRITKQSNAVSAAWIERYRSLAAVSAQPRQTVA